MKEPMVMAASRPSKNRRQNGFTLIEVLVTVLILATGILGVAALQSASLRQGGTLREDSKVQGYAQEFMEQTLALESMEGTGVLAGDPPVLAAVTKDCFTVECSRAEMATFTLYNLNKALVADIPSADLNSVYEENTSTTPSTWEYRLQITWDHDADGVVTAANGADCVGTPVMGDGSYCLVFRAR